MELYILDDQLRRIEVLDDFESFIWTERYDSAGDFEFVIASTVKTRALLVPDTKVVVNVSYYVMTIDEVEATVADDGRALLTVKGPSLEDILKARVAKATMSDLTTDPAWVMTGQPSDIARKIFEDICVEGELDAADIIPFIVDGDFLVSPGSWLALDPPDMVWDDDEADVDWDDIFYDYTPEDSEELEDITVNITPTSVFEAIQTICKSYNLGFRLVRNYENSELYFDIYSGIDRSSLEGNPFPVRFSTSLGNLTDTSEYQSTAENRTVAYVFSQNGVEVVYAADADISAVGFNRKVIYVDASDIDEPAGSTLTAMLKQRGLEALSQNRNLVAFDGEINQFGSYKYGIHFNLGDLVEMTNIDGLTTKARITEQIFVHDAQGERSYPTLTAEQTIVPGSWAALVSDLEWYDIPDDSENEWEDY